MNIKKFFPLLFLCCFQYQQPFCQVIGNRFTHYTPKDGLPDGLVNSITQDKDGFLWLGTDDGLSRFDGHTFKLYRYNLNDTTSIRENNVVKVFIGSGGSLWVLTANWLHLYHPDGEWFEHFNINVLAPDVLQNICTQESGQLIIAGNHSLYKFGIKQKKFALFPHEGLKQMRFFNYKKDEEGMEWLGTFYGLIRFDPKTKKSIFFDSSAWKNNERGNIVNSIALLPGGYIMAASYGNGIYIVNRKTNGVKQFRIDKSTSGSTIENVIMGVYQLNDTIYLMGTNNGLALFNLRKETFTFLKPDPLPPQSTLRNNNDILSIYSDREGILWLGGTHLEKYDFNDFDIRLVSANGKENSQKPFRNLFTLYRRVDGSILLGGYSGVSIYDPVKRQLRKLDDKKLNDKIADDFNEDAHGNIWCNTVLAQHTFPKICVFNIVNNRAVNIREYNVPIEKGIRDMKLGPDGNVYKTSYNGLVKFDTSAKTFTFLGSGPLPRSRFTNLTTTAICCARNGCIWVGTQKGLNKIEKDGSTIKQFSQNKKNNTLLPNWCINDIVEDSHGVIWFATNDHGIGRVGPANDSVSLLSVDQGLPASMYFRLCCDDNNNLWALSRMGILRINTLTQQNQLYTDGEGFPSPDDLTDMFYSKPNKKLYILTLYAIFEIDPQNTNYKPGVPETFITGFSVFDKERPLAATSAIHLKYNENFISIQFAALLFHSNEQIKYAYKMDGIDTGWVYCNFRRSASYTNLPPGQYVFRVRAQSPGGVWSNTPALLNINIKPPFWLSWWFYLLEGALAAVIIIWVVRLYTTRKLAKQKIEFEKQQAILIERTRIASDMHDELGAGLTSISLLSEVANQKIRQNISANNEIQKIVRSADLLSKNLTEIIWTMNTGNDRLEDFIIYIRTYAVEYFDNTSIEFTFNCPDEIPELTMAGELRRNIFLCIKEALNNIVKHAHATKASLTFSFAGNMLITEITDNGIGLNTNPKNKFGNGLNTMKGRLKKYESNLETEINGGTKLIFKIKINYTV